MSATQSSVLWNASKLQAKLVLLESGTDTTCLKNS
jgi:hypothetical protein